MADTLVIQSHRSTLPHKWLPSCLQTVRDWSGQQGYDYQYIDDSLFRLLPDTIVDNYRQNRVVLSDLARLLQLRDSLEQGYNTAVWLDADFLIFHADEFVLPEQEFAVGREVWVQRDNGKLKAWMKVHNALLMFRQGNSFIDFYIDTASRMLADNTGTIPSQFIGPKLLTALHNVVQLPVMECAGMFSPLVIHDLVTGEGDALSLFRKKSSQAVAGANLCCSSCDRQEVSGSEINTLIDVLLNKAASI